MEYKIFDPRDPSIGLHGAELAVLLRLSSRKNPPEANVSGIGFSA